MGTVDFTYDSLDRIATREAADFFYTGQMLDPTTDGTNTWTRTPAGRLIAQDDGTNDRLIGLNRHGDQSWLFGTTGTVAASTVYDPFGVAAATTGGGGSPLGFQGDYTDPTFGEVWMGARWYSATDAGFRSRDNMFGELTTPVSLNRYTYAANSPLVYWDPTGRYAEYIEGLDGPTLGGQIAEVHDQTAQRTTWGTAKKIIQQADTSVAPSRELYQWARSTDVSYRGGATTSTQAIEGALHTVAQRMGPSPGSDVWDSWPDTIVYMGGTLGRRANDDARAGFISDWFGRAAVAPAIGGNRPRSLSGAGARLAACHRQFLPDCSGAEADAHGYAVELWRAAMNSPTRRVDVIGQSYSAFELSIIFEHEEWIKDYIDHVVLLSPTKVRTGAFDDVEVSVVHASTDAVFEAPPGNNILFGSRLHTADRIPGARVYELDLLNDLSFTPQFGTLIEAVDVSHDGWFNADTVGNAMRDWYDSQVGAP